MAKKESYSRYDVAIESSPILKEVYYMSSSI
jgi:hypothetical protein